MPRRALAVAGGLTVVVGLVHLGVAAAQFRALSLDALWFAGSGLAVILIGVLSLLAQSVAVSRAVPLGRRGREPRWIRARPRLRRAHPVARAAGATAGRAVSHRRRGGGAADPQPAALLTRRQRS